MWFALHTIFRQTIAVRGYGFAFDAPVLSSLDLWALLLSVSAALAVFRFGVGMLETLAGCATAGCALYFADVVTFG